MEILVNNIPILLEVVFSSVLDKKYAFLLQTYKIMAKVNVTFANCSICEISSMTICTFLGVQYVISKIIQFIKLNAPPNTVPVYYTTYII